MPDAPQTPMSDFMRRTIESVTAARALLPPDFQHLPPRAFAAALAEAVRALTRSGYDAACERSSVMGHLIHHYGANRRSELYQALREEAAPALRDFIQAAVEGNTKAIPDDVFRAVQQLTWLEYPQVVPLAAAIAHRPFEPEHGGWRRVFTLLDTQLTLCVPMIEALANPFPPGKIAEAILGPANDACRRRLLAYHPFNCAPGAQRLVHWLSNDETGELSRAWQSAIAIQWLDDDLRAPLIDLASAHPHPEVKVELAGSLAALGDSRGLEQLTAFCMEPSISGIAQDHLTQLGAGDQIPPECSEPGFQAMVTMAGWLSSPMEYGRLPSKVSVRARRTMCWPPTRDVREMFLIEYAYPDCEPSTGVGCVGSSTFAFLSEELMNRSDDEMFALYCISEARDGWSVNNEEEIQEVIRRGKAWIADCNG